MIFYLSIYSNSFIFQDDTSLKNDLNADSDAKTCENLIMWNINEMRNFSIYVKILAHSSYFKAIIMGAILMNTVTFAISSSLEPTEKNVVYVNILDSIDSCFLALYCLEFVIKLHSYGRGYWFNGFNCFDFGVLLCSLLQVCQQSLNYIGPNLL